MSTPAMFDITTPAWAPVYIEPYPGDPMSATEGEWKAYRAHSRCRDCGEPMSRRPRQHCCEGGPPHYALCDDCAALDQPRAIEDGDAGRRVSRWGISTTSDEFEQLLAEQARRRARYLATRHGGAA